MKHAGIAQYPEQLASRQKAAGVTPAPRSSLRTRHTPLPYQRLRHQFRREPGPRLIAAVLAGSFFVVCVAFAFLLASSAH